MARMRVHEIAKELGRANREVIDYLKEKGIEVKSYMSMLEDEQVEMVRKDVGSRPAPAKREAQQSAAAGEKTAQTGEKTAENGAKAAGAPKKKNITRIFRSQNSRTGIQKPAGMRTAEDKPAGRKAAGARPAGGRGAEAGKPANGRGAEVRGRQQAAGAAEAKVRQQAAGAAAEAKPAQAANAAAETKVAQTANAAAEIKAAQTANAAAETKAAQTVNAAETKAAQTAGAAAEVKAAQTANTAAETKPAQAAETKAAQKAAPAAEAKEAPAEAKAPQTEAKQQRQPEKAAAPEKAEARGQSRAQGGRDNRDGRGDRDNNRDNRGGRGTGERNNRDGQGGRDNRDGRGDRDNNRDNRGGRGTGERNNRDQGGGRDNRDGRGDRDNNRDNRTGRSFGDRNNRGDQGGSRDNRGGRTADNRTGQGGRFGDRDSRDGQGRSRSFGDRDNNRDGRSQSRGQGGRNLSIPQPDLGSKPVTKESRIRADKEKDKEKYNKRDRFDRQEGGNGKGRPGQKNNNSGKNGKTAGKFIKPVTPPPAEKKEDEIRTVTLPDRMTIRELADILKVQAAAIVKKLFLQGTMVTVNHEIEYDMAEEIAMEYNCIAEHEVKVDVIEELLKEEEEAEETMVARPPVVCVMGHVDHGKTSLLDAIRNTHVIAKEAGGITQHIGAYTVSINGQKITFLDTPGHEAFTAMRMRGANATDIAILVVAADDGVMPQTVEAISHAKAAGTEIIVAINKIDKPSANVDRVKQELSEYGLIPEDWGGSTIFVPVSAHTHEGLDNLLEMILLTAEVAELKANPNRKARGLVIEAELDKGKGPVATVLVQKGTLHVGDAVAAGSCHGKVRAMMDDKGRRVKEAGPSTPVEILGLSDVPNAGEVFVACENDKEARSFAETFISQSKEKLLEETKSRMSLDDLFSQIQAGNLKELGIIVKADVQGSVEAVKQSLLKLSNEEVAVKIIHGGVGAINESDVSLASASNAIIIGFNVRPDAMAKASAERENVDVRLYRVIYDAIADVEAAMKGMLDPVYEEKVIGHAEVRQIFKASGVGNIAGSYVLDGIIQRGCSVRITREGTQIFEGKLASLKRFKDDVKEVRAGYECGLVFEKFNDIQEFDQVEAYIMVEVPR
ncbi:translation initiation factor IF-2 [Marvinbryantia formatexigens]|nr:translation initiation factor IF-2 [Marvinbryantia formatexigens]SDG91709.1 translation initiation factor IF-2 [Marvinbryantia formatexigens]